MSRCVIKRMLLLTCILLSQIALCETAFVPGYLITIQKDTIHGFIKHNGWLKTPDAIHFKASKGGNITTYKPIQIAGFGLLNMQYVSACVQKEVSPYKDTELNKDPNLHLVLDTVFLQTLVGGSKPLYYYIEQNEKEHFYIKEDSVYSLLLHKVYVEYKNGRKEFHNMRFLGQLSRYFWDEETLQDKIANTVYTRPSLEALFSIYSELHKSSQIYQAIDHKAKTVFGVFVGTSFTMVIVETDLIKAGFGPSVNVTGGLSIDLPMKGLLRDFSFYNELMYSSYKMEKQAEDPFPFRVANFDFKYLKMNNIIRFQPSWFFVNAGVSSGFCLHHNSTVFSEVRKYEIGLVFGAGLKYKRYSLEAREDIGDGMSPYLDMISATNRFQLLLGYQF